ncbi:T9SS type A sorting domain-containing protein [Psychroflexus salinarum]|uniref:T9SS type A sorting domain-containing protein n=1 Tax=Psychroflexus salinarum TaxID=546024 RepID=A0ABW3GP62_9FLAO
MNKITFLGIFLFLFISLNSFSQNCPPNLPSDPVEGEFGNNEWIAYAYNHNNYTTTNFNLLNYRGYYVDSGYGNSGVSFDSSNSWGENSNPSTSVNYEGCSVTDENHNVRYMRRGFPEGNYVIDVASQNGGNGHDDAAILYIDGVQVWNNTGCCAPRLNVWSGTLDANSEIEFIWSERTGDSYGRLRFKEATPASGDEGDFGDNEWLVSAYNGTNFNTYAGIYSQSGLDFDSRDLWPANGSPSQAQTYNGVTVAGNNHSYIYRRRGFPCGIYQLNIPAHDDDVVVTIDGDEVFSSEYVDGDRINNVWQGYLGPNSEIEYSIVEFGGQSYGSLEFIDIAGPNQFIWTGDINTSVTNTGNWCGGVLPLNNGTSNLYIPKNVPNFPISNLNSSINDILIETGAALTLNSDLQLRGNLVNDGTLNGANGSLDFVGPNNHSISGNGFEIENLSMDNDVIFSLNLGEVISLSDILTVDGGTLNTNDRLSLTCDFTSGKAAQVAPVLGAIVGDVTVEQCYPARRAFRFISPSVTTSSTIRENWQEDAQAYNILENTDGDPIPNGYGTHITGNNTSEIDNSLNGGLDYTPSGNPSMFTFDNIGRGWNPVTSTEQPLEAGSPYRLMIRGDRGIDVTSNSATPTNTRLRTTGVLTTGPNSQTNLSDVAGSFNFIANPYHAQVDMNLLTTNSSNIRNTFYYVWDPTLAGSGGRGAYVTVDLSDGSTSFTDTGISGSPLNTANEFLQPMQAAFVLVDTNTGPTSVDFEESHKNVNPDQTETKSLSQSEYINIQLFDADSYTQGNTASDGLKIKFDKSYSTTSKDDAPKLGNLDENLARKVGSDFSSIELRPFPEEEERLELFINQYRREAYVMKFDLTDNLNTQVFIEDKYLNQVTEVTQTEDTYSFTVDESIPESEASDRFSLVFEPVSLSTIEETLVNASLYPNPTKGSFSISGENLGEETEVEIYNMIGQQVYKTNLENQLTTEITDFNGSAGVYLVKLKTNQGERTFKLIKQ